MSFLPHENFVFLMRIEKAHGTFERSHTVKSCIKAVAYVQFFNFVVWLLFKCGFYLRRLICKILSLQNP